MFDRDEQEISQIIEVGIEAVLSGASTMEEVIAAHPEQAAILRSELETANWLIAQQAQVSARPGFVAASRKRVVARIQEEASNHSAKHGLFGFFIWPQRIAYQWAAALAIVVMLLSGTGGLVSASQGALPGDRLYAVKRISEEFAYTITFNATQRMQLSIKYARIRLQEAAALISKKNYEAVLPVLQEFQQQVNQAVALLQQAANGNTKDSNELKQQKSVAIALKANLLQNADALEMMQATMLPPDVKNGILDAQQLSQSSLETTEAMISNINTDLGFPNETPTLTPTLVPSETNTPGAKDATTDTPTPASTPDATQDVSTPQPDDLSNPVIVATPTPTGTWTKDSPGNSSHLTPPPGQQNKDNNNPPKDKGKPPKADTSPPGQANSAKPTKQAN